MRAQRTVSTTASVIALAFLALLGTGTGSVARADSAAAARTSASYAVRRGDTLGSIAARHGLSLAALVAQNAISNPNLIRVGQVLTLPASAASTATPAAGAPARAVVSPAGGATTHIVKVGDTIGGLARRYGIPSDQLVAANGITDLRIYVGQRLLLVPTTPAPTAPSATSGTHVVTAGQTLSDVARRYGTTVAALAAANGITNVNLVVSGRRLSVPGSAALTSSLACPIQGPMRHTNDWGFPRSGGRFHVGNDLFAARGTPAAAVVGGNAIQTVGSIGGKQVKLLGDDGATYYYTHLDQFGAAGRVRAGQVIGLVGTSGNAVGGPPHVHFEMHPGGGEPANPFARIAAAC